jgi:4-hydroxyproline epimerase
VTRISVIDSHTEGEPTRIVVEGGPDLGSGPIADRAHLFRERFDHLRSAIVNEPRGHDAVVGAFLLQPVNPRAAAAVIFFNNVGLLHSCGHGTIGLAATLAHLGRIKPGSHIVETPVGEVTINLAPDGAISIDNVPSYRHAAAVPISFEFEGKLRTVTGDIAWGGNWFYLVNDHGLDVSPTNIDTLTAYTWSIRQALNAAQITGKNDAEIDHVELFAPPRRTDCDSRNFVLCPGRAYDRSPCGTGTSAKMACLYADGKLKPGQLWRQESIIGSRFIGQIRLEPGGKPNQVIPTISGRAYITAEATLILDDLDPFKHGIRL